MKKIVLCLFILGIVGMSSHVTASEMKSEVGIEFSETIKDPPKKRLPNTDSPKSFLPKTGDAKGESIKYSFIGFAILASVVLFLKVNRKRGEI